MSEDASIALQHYLEAEVQRRNIHTPVAVTDFLVMLRAAGINTQANSDYLYRIAQVAHERYLTRGIVEDVPAIAIAPVPLDRRQIAELLGDRLNYAVVFGAESILFQDTVHALAVDSKQAGGVNVLGIHADWLSSDNAGAGRAIIMDVDGLIREVAFEEAVPIHIVQILHLPLKGERQLHRKLSSRFRDRGILQINPYAGGSERADDKAWTHALWEQSEREIASPKYTLIPQDSSPKQVIERLKAFVRDAGLRDIVVQPNKGTEGYHVEEFHSDEGFESVLMHIQKRVLPEDDAIVREKRGNVRYTDPLSGSFLNVTFRVNVTWNGSGFVAESGYAQVARDEKTFPASRGRGGAIVDINEALANLCYPQGGRWVRLIPTDGDIAAMKTAAEDAAHAINAGLDAGDYLKLMGIDALLEVGEAGAMTPVMLEANPRPAGLSHSSEITGISYRNPRQHVSKEIFKLAGDFATK